MFSVPTLTQPAIAKLKIDFETLKKYNPNLFMGLRPAMDLQAGKQPACFDSVAQARSGIMYALGGEPDTPPAQIGGPVFDQMTGTLLVYGILAALVARDRQGTGQQVEVSLLDRGYICRPIISIRRSSEAARFQTL